MSKDIIYVPAVGTAIENKNITANAFALTNNNVIGYVFLCLSIQENDFCTEKNFSFSLRMVLVYRVIVPFMDFLFDKKISFLVNWIRVNQQQRTKING